MTEGTDIARQWVTKACNDLLNADNNLQCEQVPYDTVCFHCQQATEKLLKAYLAGIGKALPVTHDLMLLLERILPSNPEAEQLRDSLALLMPYAVEIRYPDDWFMPTAQDTQEAREATESVVKWLKDAMPTLF
ncbi:MAG: HEPN domain-containing protein [Planctomycetota bacterium]|jgi:HEPN domain-containing protein